MSSGKNSKEKKITQREKNKVIGALEESCTSLFFGNYLELVSSNGFLSFDFLIAHCNKATP